ncbi:MAG: O-antigen ligase family protein [Gemmatimonadales bacterium]
MSGFAAPAQRTAPMLQGGLYLLVASIPFEYPERTIPLEIPTLTGAIFLLGTLLHPGRCYGRLPAPALWFGAYLVAFLLSIAVVGEHAGKALSEFVIVLQGVLVFLAAGNLMTDEKVARRVLVTLVAAGSVRAALPFLGLGRTTSSVWTGGERISALGQNANSAAMIMAAALVALVGLLFLRRRNRGAGLVLASMLAVLLGMAILETGSRGGLAALLGGVLVFAWAADTWRQRLRNGAVAVLAITLLTVATLRLPMMKNRLLDTVTTGTLAGREQLYPALWKMFLERPVMGWGPITNTHELALRIGERERPKRAAHNILLELLTAGGLVTALPFVIGVWLSVRSAWRARAGPHGVLPLALFCSLFIANMSGDWIASKLLWVVLAYALASGRWPGTLPHRHLRQSRRQPALSLPSGIGVG